MERVERICAWIQLERVVGRIQFTAWRCQAHCATSDWLSAECHEEVEQSGLELALGEILENVGAEQCLFFQSHQVPFRDDGWWLCWPTATLAQNPANVLAMKCVSVR